MSYNTYGFPGSRGKRRGLKVLMVVVPVMLVLLIVALVVAAVVIPRMIDKAALDDIPHVGKRVADARVAEALRRTEDATNPPLKLHLVGPDNSSSCDMNDGVQSVDGSRFNGLYDLPVADPAAGTTLMNKIGHYWAGQPDTEMLPLPGVVVIWRPDTPPGRENFTDQLDVTITISVSPPNKYQHSFTLGVWVEGQCVADS